MTDTQRAVTDKHTTTAETREYQIAACGMQGWRKSMEDAHVVEFEIDRDRNNILVAVFDGHNGGRVAKWCSEHLLSQLLGAPSWRQQNYGAAMTEAFLTMDDNLRTVFGQADDGGCTAVAVLIMNSVAYCANVGDSRAVLYREGGVVHPLSYDHKPSDPKEIDRITRAGGMISNGRVNGMLTLTRALGDFELKENIGKGPLEQIISPMPDVIATQLLPTDRYIAVGCDGVWETKSNEDIDKVITEALRANNDDLGLACEALLDSCLATCSYGLGTDNMTIVLVRPIRA